MHSTSPCLTPPAQARARDGEALKDAKVKPEEVGYIKRARNLDALQRQVRIDGD